MAKEEQTHGFSRFSRMFFCILIAALFWLIIKLSDTYSVNIPFAIHYVDIPASQLIQDNDQEVDATVTTTGFKLLNYYFSFKSNRKIDISLNEIKLQRKDHITYSFNSQYIADKIALFLSTSPTDVQIKDDATILVMHPLAYKKVRIVPETNISFEKQYNYYGEPTILPDSVTIYGTFNDIKGVNEVKTEEIVKKKVRNSFKSKVKLYLDDKITADIDEVEVSFNVERYTESKREIPITTPDNVQMNLYPKFVQVRYMVAMKDYANINSQSFKVTIDTTNMFYSKLPVKLALYPNNIQIIGIEPKEVEYFIISQQ